MEPTSVYFPRATKIFVAIFVLLIAACNGDGAADLPSQPSSWVKRWNQIAVDASGLDHARPGPEETRVFGEQLGPTRASRAIAIVHIAMFDAVNSIQGGYQGYAYTERAAPTASVKAAVTQSAHDTLSALFPSQSEFFDGELERDLSHIPNSRAKEEGIALGRRVAAAILSARTDDGSELSAPGAPITYVSSSAPGRWRPDPINPSQQPLGSAWDKTRPFVLESASQFRAPPPPPLTSEEYVAAYDEVKRFGGDGVTTPTERTDDQTHIGIFWAYDGMPSLCAPPRLYNQVALQVADNYNLDVLELARLLALVNVAMADAGIAIWESKYHYDLWRPVTGIREADPGTGPTGLGDSNRLTTGDISFTPLGAPASNLTGPNFTPPFPSYPSGHAGFGGALFQMLRNYFGTDAIGFTFTSDEFNGETRDNFGIVRPLLPRSFSTLSQAEEENGQSRIYLGIHWSFDKTKGIEQGRNVADYVYQHAFLPVN